MSNRTKIGIIAILAILALLTPAVSGVVVTQDVEIRGSVANGTETYNYANFAGFWYDLDKDRWSETMTVNCSGPDNRTVAEGDLTYKCIPRDVKYKNPDLNDEYGGYKILGFMAEKFICYDNRTDQLVKLLIEQKSSVKTVLSTGSPIDLPEGYMLTMAEIDLQGDKVWLKLYKDGECIDDNIVLGGDTYMFEDDDDVLLFSCKIDSVFRGTESNLVVVKFVFLRSTEILDVDGGDSFGVMAVKGTSGNITLKNDDDISLDADSEVEIMDGLYFKVADDDTLRYYLAKTVSLVCPECPDCPDCPEPEPCPEIMIPVATSPEIVEEIPTVIVTTTPADKPNDDPGNGNTTPGFEAAFTIAGLLAIACLVLKQRE